PEEARFCQACGSPMVQAPAEWEQRKTVTVVFADVTGSTALGEALDPESLRRLMARFFMEMSAVLQRHGGSVEKFIGDAVLAVFGRPTVHEDDALRAVRAAAEMRQVLRSLNEELQRAHGVTLQIRTGVNTGTVIIGDLVAGQSFVAGDAINVAARLEQLASPGEILIGEDTYRLVRHAVTAEPAPPLKVRNREEPVVAYRLEDVHDAAPRGESPLRSPMVGRVRDLGVLLDLVDEVTKRGDAHLATILGPAGVGKSRLVEELVAGLGEQLPSLSGRCLTYGEGITYWPVSEVVRQALGIRGESSPAEIRRLLAERVRGSDPGDRIVEGVAQMMGLSDAAGGQEQMFWGTRRFLEVVAGEKPLLVILDDVHWGEPTFLDFVEYLADFASAPLLLVCMARLDLLEERPGWGTGRRNATTLTLDPLTEGESVALIRNLLGIEDLEPAAGRHLIRATEGNPLFIEEMLRMLIDEGLVKQDDEGWASVGDVTSLPAPPTIQALLSARLARLRPEELAAIERASVVGKVFSWSSVAALTPEEERSEVGGHLQALVRKELILPDTEVIEGEDTFRFRHLMIRDAAYEAIPKEVRADLHELLASWLEARGGEEYDEILGHHLEQAHRWRTEIAPADNRSRALAERAVEQFASAGRRAFARGDVPATVRLLSHAVALVPDEHPTRPRLLADLGRALMEHGELERADEVLTEAAR
ncbi:MAG TPA: adenylate/guanylate cyclase domain-containing protein, partial [Actinomycetota bacterium]